MTGVEKKPANYSPRHGPTAQIRDLSLLWRSRLAPRDRPPILTTATSAMPALSHELLITAVEMVCYFCTAIGVVFAFLFGCRA